MSWFVQKDQGGGPIVDGAIHNLDFARYMFGEAERVAACTMTFREDATAADTGSALVRFVGRRRSGAVLVVGAASWRTQGERERYHRAERGSVFQP